MDVPEMRLQPEILRTAWLDVHRDTFAVCIQFTRILFFIRHAEVWPCNGRDRRFPPLCQFRDFDFVAITCWMLALCIMQYTEIHSSLPRAARSCSTATSLATPGECLTTLVN